MTAAMETFFTGGKAGDLISKKDFLLTVGITQRKLSYWQAEGIFSGPVLYKGQGGQSHFNRLQWSAAKALAFLQIDCGQSIGDIKQILKRMQEDAPDSDFIREEFKNEPGLCLYPLFLQSRTLTENPSILEEFKNGKKIFSANAKGGFVDLERHDSRYTEIDGSILKIIRKDEFDHFPLWFLEASPINVFADEVVDGMLGLHYDVDPETDVWNEKRDLFLQLVDKSIMLPPSYHYRGKVYYSNPDLSCGAFLICFAEIQGIDAAKRIVKRIREDINMFFHFPHESSEYSASFLRFKKEVEIVRDALCDLDDIRLDGPEGWYGECTETFFEGFLEGRIRMKPNCIDNSIMFQGPGSSYQTSQRS